MNQPKFKLGDKVRVNGIGDTFTVGSSYKNSASFLYSEKYGEKHYKESELELYTEPKNKKLYAYEYAGSIKFYVKEYGSVNIGSIVYERCPEYDLNYSDKE